MATRARDSRPRDEQPRDQQPREERRQGLFIVLEGGEGSGKSTQVAGVAARLRAAGRDVVETFEPGATLVGKEIRHLLLTPGNEIQPLAEVLLYAADRAQHVHEVVLPALRRGSDVVSDRHLWSSLAYQGGGRELGVDVVEAANLAAVAGVPGTITVLLDVPPEVGLARAGSEPDRIEAESIGFHERVRATFLDLAARHGAVVVDATAAPDEVADAVWDGVRRIAEQRGVRL